MNIINGFLFLVLSDGLPIPNTTCDSLYPGRTGSSKGSLESPSLDKSEIYRSWNGPLKCTKSLVPTDSQSLTLKVDLHLTTCNILGLMKSYL